MTISNGLYKVEFGTPIGAGYGVVHMIDGKLYGGDSMMAYVGSYKADDNAITAEVSSFQHSHVDGMQSVLGSNAGTINFTGQKSGDIITLSGPVAGAGINVSAKLSKIA